MAKPEVTVFFEPDTHTVCSVVRDPRSLKVAVVDSVMGFDFPSGNTNTNHADSVIEFIQKNGLEVEWILETHAHADHLSAAPYIQGKLGGKIAIGENIRHVQDVFAGVFNLGPDFKKDGSQFDKLFADGESFQIGELKASVIYTPGHTPACVCYLIGDALHWWHLVHARLWHRSLWLSWWLLSVALWIHPEDHGSARWDSSLCGPWLSPKGRS